MADFDIFVIGAGGAGVAAAIQSAELGATVAIAETGTVGGTCVNVGCIPSKNLIQAGEYYHTARHGFPGIEPCDPVLDWKAVLQQKNALVEELRQTKYLDVLRSYPDMELLEAPAQLLGDGGVQAGTVKYRARKIIVATGAAPAMPPISGLADVNALTSTTAMELGELPASLLVLGGSSVGLELGQAFARFGTKVTIVELEKRLLPNDDETVAEVLRAHLEAEGLKIHTGMQTVGIERGGDQVVLQVENGSLKGELRAQHLLLAVGRRPNTAGLGLDLAGVELTQKGFIKVDAFLRTTSPDVFAAGDVTGGPAFVYVAAQGGRIAAHNALKAEATPLDLTVVPSVTFTSPQVGSVGLTEAQARAAGHQVEVSVLEMKHAPRALVSHDTRGMVKIVAEAGSGKLLGVHSVAPHAGEFMGEAALALRFGLTARDLVGTLHPYLTWIETVRLAAQGFSMDVSKLSCCA
ncbi:MAG: mercury(II) reductase [Gemmatimonadales bacterium]